MFEGMQQLVLQIMTAQNASPREALRRHTEVVLPDLTDAHLHKLTLAFDAGLRAGTITVDVAGIFVDRVFEAWLEARVRADPKLKHDAVYGGAYRAITLEGNGGGK